MTAFVYKKHVFFQQYLCNLNSLHDDFVGTGTATVDLRNGLWVGNAPGGVAILYRKTLSSSINLIDLGHDWCTGISIKDGNKTVMIVTVYMTYQCVDNESEYLDKLGQLSAVMEDINTSSFLIIGDWNANLRNTGQNMFAKFMIDFCNDHSLQISSQLLLPKDSFSYISDSWGTKTWLDHAFASYGCHESISSMCIGYDIAQDDHMPVLMTLDVVKLPNISEGSSDKVKLNWKKLHNDDILKYNDSTEIYLRDIELSEGVHCTDVNCTNPSHVEEVEQLYDKITECLIKAGNEINQKSDKQRHPLLNLVGISLLNNGMIIPERCFCIGNNQGCQRRVQFLMLISKQN